MPPLSNLRVVLVRPHYAGNVGSVCRLLKNFGGRDLVVVDPVADLAAVEARMFATRGVDILDSARVVPTLADAVAGCTVVLATSGETGGLTRKGFWGTPEEKLPLLTAAMRDSTAALVFGPEPHGLTADEVAVCHGSVYIPADPDYPSLNLAQAAAVCLYQLFRLAEPSAAPAVDADDRPAAFEDQERAYRHLYEGLAAVRFLWDFRAEGIYHVLRQMLNRARPTPKELRVLHGLSRQLIRVAARWGVPHPRGDDRPNSPPFEGRRRTSPPPPPLQSGEGGPEQPRLG